MKNLLGTALCAIVMTGCAPAVVVPNLFDLDSYLVGVSISHDQGQPEFEVHYSGTGPLVELLGRGAHPPNPIVLGLDDIELPYQLGRLKMVAQIDVVHPLGDDLLVYQVLSKPRRLNPLLADGAIDFNAFSSITTTLDGAQLTADSDGDFGFADGGGGALDGVMTWSVSRKGAVDLVGTYAFDGSVLPEVTYACP